MADKDSAADRSITRCSGTQKILAHFSAAPSEWLQPGGLDFFPACRRGRFGTFFCIKACPGLSGAKEMYNIKQQCGEFCYAVLQG